MKKNDDPIRQLIKFSNYSLCITLPKEFIDSLCWQQGDRIYFRLENNKTNLILTREKIVKIDPKPAITENTTLADLAQISKPELELPSLEPLPIKEIAYDSLEPIPQIN